MPTYKNSRLNYDNICYLNIRMNRMDTYACNIRVFFQKTVKTCYNPTHIHLQILCHIDFTLQLRPSAWKPIISTWKNAPALSLLFSSYSVHLSSSKWFLNVQCSNCINLSGMQNQNRILFLGGWREDECINFYPNLERRNWDY